MKTQFRLLTAAIASTLAIGGLASGAGASAERDPDLATEKVGEAEQTAFSHLLLDVTELYPHAVVDHSWHHTYGVISVKSDARAAVQELALNSGVRVDVLQASDDLIAFADRDSVELAALDSVSGIDAVASAATYDPGQHEIVVTVWTDDVSSAAAEASSSLGVQSLLTDVGPSVTVMYESADEAPQAASTTQGGENYGTCTGGFVAKRNTDYGILTAAHCTYKPSKYDGDTTGSSFTASNNVDMRYTILTGGVAQNKFRVSSSTLRTINAVGVVTQGLTLYKYGKETGYGNATVKEYAGCIYYGNVDATYCRLWRMDKDVTDGGDSGGPWFRSYTGYGLTSGSGPSGSLITPIANVSTIKSGSVTVKTS